MIDRDEWLKDFMVTRPHPVGNLAERFEKVIDSAKREEDLQNFLAENPFILSEQFPHGTHVVPKFSFGGKYVSDFLISEITSGGTFWILVELEPADAPLITQGGQLSKRVREGVQQVRDWRDWLNNNRDHAIRPRARDGLGLGDIEGVWGWVVVGRRSKVTDRFNQLRREVAEESRIDILTYDRLLEWIKKRADHWNSWDQSIKAWQLSKEE